MAVYKWHSHQLQKLEQTTFADAGLKERQDMQRLLRTQIEAISPETLIIAEEFCEWEDSRCRIDLLALDKDANLVVIELKRIEDGGHMELQAIRYAAMISPMTFEKVMQVYADYLRNIGSNLDARSSLLSFLDWKEPDEERFGQDVRIILVSPDFSRELTTAVIWLNDQGLDIRCIRIKPYLDQAQIFVDIQQVIPLPEASEFMVKIKQKEAQERRARQEQSHGAKLYGKFWDELLTLAREKTDLHATISSPGNQSWCSRTMKGLNFVYAFGHDMPRVELYFNRPTVEDNKAIFDRFIASKETYERAFGAPLIWERLEDRKACRISAEVASGSIRDEATWPELQVAMIDSMIRLSSAFRDAIQSL